MKCQGKFIFKTLTHRKSGVFTNDKGEEFKYSSAYILKVDELGENGDINERKFKISEKSTDLIQFCKELEPYQQIILSFNIVLFNGQVLLSVENISIADDE